MRDLSQDDRRLIEALIRGPRAWQTPRELARGLGSDLEETTDRLADLDASGWLEAWDLGSDPVVTLTVAGASALAVRLVESTRGEIPRWANRADPEPPGARASGVFRDERAASLERVVDPSPSPEELLERSEDAMRRPVDRTDPRIETLAGPTLLIGLGLVPWPGPGNGRKMSCPACGSKPLRPSMYCLYCDRWGLDHRLKVGPPRSSLRRADPKEPARKAESERRARQAKRLARRLAQAETDRASRSKRRLPA